MNYFVHPQALCESKDIGKDTRVWAFAHILPGARIGSDCNICDSVFIENKVVVGNRVTIKCGVQLWDGVTLEDDVFIGPNVTFSNDLFPRSKQYPEAYASTLICKGASIGANATLLPGIVVGQNAMIGAGAVVTHSVSANVIVVGNPARVIGYVNAKELEVESLMQKTAITPSAELIQNVGVKGVTLHHLSYVEDNVRGHLSVGEFEKDVPFVPKRYFLVFDVPSEKVRGEHAHYQCQQFLVCVQGSCSVIVDDGQHRKEIVLDRPNVGLYLPPMIWGVQYKYSEDAVLLVFASHYYEPQDYIRDYDIFLDAMREAEQR
jgi:acetyltransferase-like isoleucine patch superfamily enzyme